MIDTIAVRPGTNGVEVYAFLVGATVFKTGETEVLGLAGSIPVHLRHRPGPPGPSRPPLPRRPDHINYLGVEVVPNRDYLRDTLGAMVTEQIVLDDGSTAGSWTTSTNKGYDAVYTRDWTGTIASFHTHGTPPVDQTP